MAPLGDSTVKSTPLRDEPIHHQVAFIVRHIWTHPSNRDRRLRRLLFSCYFQARTRLLSRPMVVHVGRRSRIFARLHQSATSEVVYAHPHDRNLLHWERVVRPDDLFIDVGANVGVYSIWALEQGAEVIAVEPLSAACNSFRENMQLNGYTPEILQVAVADRNGTMPITSGLDVANHLVRDDSSGSVTTEVPVTTLDSVIGERTVAGLKLDVEGAEFLALQGGARALSEHRIRLIQIEWNHCSLHVVGEDRRPLAELLLGHGYKLFRFREDGSEVELDDYSFGPDVWARPRMS